MISIEDQISFTSRELQRMVTQYTHLVASGKMSGDVAAREIETMRAVLRTLLYVQAGRKVRAEG
jgi:hypothetical protein